MKFTISAALVAASIGFLGSANAQDTTTMDGTQSTMTSTTTTVVHHDKKKSKKKRPSSPDDVRFGVIGGVGFPRPLSVGAFLAFDRTVMIGAEYSALPTSSLGSVDVGMHAVTFDARIFPIRGPFYIGFRAGKQHLEGSTTVSVDGYGTMNPSLTMDTWFVNPRLGLLWRFDWGLNVGIEAGVQVPVGHTTQTNLPSSVAVPQSVSNITDFFGARIIPSVTLLQLGMSF